VRDSVRFIAVADPEMLKGAEYQWRIPRGD